MTTLRKLTTAAVAAATLGGAGYFMPIAAASAQGYYSPGNGYYGKPYNPPAYVYQPPKCHWERYKYPNPYGYGWLWGRKWVCN